MSAPRAVLTRARDRLARVASPYPLASTLALGGLTTLDALVVPGARDALFPLSLACLVVVLGTTHGVLWQLALSLVARLPGRARPFVWALLACAVAALLAHRLGAFAQLQGRYARVAMAVLGACATGAAGLALLLVGLQPSPARRRGHLGSLGRATRALLAGMLLAAAAGIFVADHTLYVGLYPDAHVAMRLAALLLSTCALVLIDAELRLPRLSPASLAIVALSAVVPLALIDETRPRLLEAFAGRPWCAALLDAARATVDFDRDGYASLLGGGDCAPLDSRSHPSAREIPGNGIDDNCMFGDAERSSSVSEPLVPARGPAPMDVVLITVDTLRADHLGVYSAAHRTPPRMTSPNLDRWAAQATVFDRAYTPGAWTSITLATLMHGIYPRRLRWTRYYETTYSLIVQKRQLATLRKGDRAERMFPFAFDDPRWPLAQRLQRRGMQTAAILDDGYTEILKAGTGLERGFGTYRDVDAQPLRKRNDEGAVDLALDFVSKVPASRRFFLWLHLFGPHGPDQRHLGVPSFGTSPADLYDHEIAFMDKQVQRLLAVLDARPSPVAVLFTSDHGEILYPTMRYHGHQIDEGSIRIPLIAKVPGWPAGRVQTTVSLIDLMPTILKLTHTPWLAPLDGIDLGPVAKGKPPAPRVLLTDTWKFQRTTTDDPEEKILDLVAAYDGDRKVVFDRIRQQWTSYPSALEGTPAASATPMASGDLQNAIRAYLEDTGGELRIVD
jgi:hypothetical protein